MKLNDMKKIPDIQWASWAILKNGLVHLDNQILTLNEFTKLQALMPGNFILLDVTKYPNAENILNPK